MTFSPRRILVATDFSDTARYAAEAAAELAQKYQAELILFHATPLTAAAEYPIDLTRDGHAVFQFESAVRRVANQEGQAECERLRGLGVEPRFVTVDGPAAMQTVLAAEREGCDLIVVGSEGRTGMGRILLGSVAEAVVRRAHVPVLTVHKPKPAP